MYDGATDHLDLLPMFPLTNPVEMNADLSAVVVMMKADPVYRNLFCSSTDGKINSENMLKALSQFMVMMISSNSKYDKFRRNESGGTIFDGEAAGYALFNQNVRLVVLQI
jgi:cytochrome c peroxidase